MRSPTRIRRNSAGGSCVSGADSGCSFVHLRPSPAHGHQALRRPSAAAPTANPAGPPGRRPNSTLDRPGAPAHRRVRAPLAAAGPAWCVPCWCCVWRAGSCSAWRPRRTSPRPGRSEPAATPTARPGCQLSSSSSIGGFGTSRRCWDCPGLPPSRAGLLHDEAGPAACQGTEMDQMPVLRIAVDRAVLAHGGHPGPIRKGRAAEGERREETAHRRPLRGDVVRRVPRSRRAVTAWAPAGAPHGGCTRVPGRSWQNHGQGCSPTRMSRYVAVPGRGRVRRHTADDVDARRHRRDRSGRESVIGAVTGPLAAPRTSDERGPAEQPGTAGRSAWPHRRRTRERKASPVRKQGIAAAQRSTGHRAFHPPYETVQRLGVYPHRSNSRYAGCLPKW